MSYDFSKLTNNLKETEEWLSRELSGVRTGRATPTLLDTIRPEIYGSRTPIQQVASVGVEDARTLRVVPWDKSVIKIIEKAITEADLGVGVGSDEQGVRVTFPELTGERRALLIKLVGEKLETARVTIRGHRTDAIKEIDASEKEGGMGKDEAERLKKDVQKHIDTANETLEALAKKKEVEISQ